MSVISGHDQIIEFSFTISAQQLASFVGQIISNGAVIGNEDNDQTL